MSEDSIYESELPDRPAYPRLEGRMEADIAIVGGGLTGISAALTLAESGISAVVLEAGRIGAGGSGRNGGHLCQGWPTDFEKISRQLDAADADIA